jgi:hypothetical protein
MNPDDLPGADGDPHQALDAMLGDKTLKALLKTGAVGPSIDAALTGNLGVPQVDLGPSNVPYSLTEEFTSVYRLHSLLPEQVTFPDGSAVGVPAMRLDKAHALAKQFGIAPIMQAFGNTHPGQLTLHNYPSFLQNLDQMPGFVRYDVGAADIIRDRERGVPRYNAFRRALQLKPLQSLDDLQVDDPQTLADLKQVYGDDGTDAGRAAAIEQLDLLVGCLAEGKSVRPEFYGFGETTFQIFLLMAPRRLESDRFYRQNFNVQTYTPEGMDRIHHVTMKTLLIRNYPALSDALANVDNAFRPWDGSAGPQVPWLYPDQ